MKFFTLVSCLFIPAIFLLTGCSKKEEGSSIIKEFIIDRNDVIGRSDARFDEDISSDGNGSIVINADKPAVIPLYETGDIDIENAQLVYQAQVRTEGVTGNVFLEMWCSFPGRGESFSRGLESTVTGTTGWKTLQTRFFLKKGDNPDNVKLNIAIDGKGIVWVDDLKLIKEPFNATD